MRNSILIFCAALLPLGAVAATTDSTTIGDPVVKVSASLAARDGQPRVFWGRNGRTSWSPSLPAYRGDILTVAYSVENGPQPERVSIKLDDRALADLRKAPWQVTIDTSKLTPGRHVVSSDVRLSSDKGMYTIAEYVFFIHEPRSEVKGMVQELGSPDSNADLPAEPRVRPPAFRGPSRDSIDESFEVILRSLDTDADKALGEGKAVELNRPVAFYLEPHPGLDRWAYTITRNGRQIAGAGPVSRLLYLDLAPRSAGEPGLLPGEVTLRVWGVRSNGKYSRQVDITLVVASSE